MELEVFFKTYSKLVISFMNRKSSCGYATHFFFLIFVVFDFSRIIFCLTFDSRKETVRDTLDVCFLYGCVIEVYQLSVKKMMNGRGREVFFKNQ
jgi:hypothetical protein